MAKLPPREVCKSPEGRRARPRRKISRGSGVSVWGRASSPKKGTFRVIADALSALAHYSPSRVRGNSRGLLFFLRERLQFRLFNVEVGVDVRNVFVVFQFFHQPQHLIGLLA